MKHFFTMAATKMLPVVFFLSISMAGWAQAESITYELNGRNPTENQKNPFRKFVGEWTLKNDQWTHNWGGETETISIPKHHTVSAALNTDNSLLSILDGPQPNGHIFWSYNPNTKEVHHLSSFGEIRAGSGKGTVSETGDLELKLVFEGEPKDTYRIYHYRWIDENEYHMKSVQYNQSGAPTGLFYEGTFVRIQKATIAETPEEEVLRHGKTIREAFKRGDLEAIKSLHHPEVKKALGYTDLKKDRKEVVDGLVGLLESYQLEFVENTVESLLVMDSIAIEQTRFVIQGTPKDKGEPFTFKGRTMVTYVRYSQSPTGWATIREIIQPATE